MTQVIPDPKYTKSYATIERASRAGKEVIEKVAHYTAIAGHECPHPQYRTPRFVVVPTSDIDLNTVRYSPVFFGGDPALLCHVMQLGYMVVN